MIDIQGKTRVSKPRKNALSPDFPLYPVPDDGIRWFAMRVTYRRNKPACELLEREGVEYFIPMRHELVRSGGKRRRVLVPVVRSLLFVHARPSRIRAVKERAEYLQYMMNGRTGEKIVVPEAQMRRFIAVAGSYDEQLLWLDPCELNLSKGTRVRVTGGPFEGQEGVFLKVKGARDRRVVIEIQGVIAVAMATLPPELVEPI